MTRDNIAKVFGETWVDFMVPFVQSDEFKTILNTLKEEKAAGKVIYPDQSVVFRCFKELPLDQVRVVLIGQDPYPIEGYATGLAFGHPMDRKIAPSLEKVIDAVEVDAYNGLNFDKNTFNTELTQWQEQGVLLLNAALTVEKGIPDSHAALWLPFTQYVINTLTVIKRDLVFLTWGAKAQKLTEKIHFVAHFNFYHEHPAAAARAKKKWDCKHFSLTNACITGNRLGEPIKW